VGARYEWWDGTGYPSGLRGDDIPSESRVLAIADTLDTLQQPRRYRAALSESAALAEVRRGRGTQFDPTIVDLLDAQLLEDPIARSAL
jgi:HD-GYP domain-containing protein (c-di-GMP phosphodiesterase class II)